jgi:hypothetical protein
MRKLKVRSKSGADVKTATDLSGTFMAQPAPDDYGTACKCLKSLEAGVGIEPAYTDLQWDRKEKVSEYQAHTFCASPIGTKQRHKIGTATQATKKDVL